MNFWVLVLTLESPAKQDNTNDLVEIFTPNGDHISFVVDEIYDEDMNLVDVCRHPDDIYYLKLDSNIEIPEYSMIKIVKWG